MSAANLIVWPSVAAYLRQLGKGQADACTIEWDPRTLWEEGNFDWSG